MIRQWVSRIALVFTFLTLGGCFFSDIPILLPVDGDRLPGGNGKFQAIEDNQGKSIFIQVEKLRSFKHEYEMTYVDEDGEQKKVDLLFKKVGGEIYVVQMYSDKKYIISSARIDKNSFRFFEYDENTFEEQLTIAGFDLLIYGLLSNNSEAKKQAKAFQKAGREFAISEIGGYTLFGGRRQIRKFASELAKSQASSSTSNKTFQRVK